MSAATLTIGQKERGTLHWQVPSAILPSLSWIWLVILVLAALTALTLRGESRRVDSAA